MTDAASRIRASIGALPDWLQTEWQQGEVESGAVVNATSKLVLFRAPLNGKPSVAAYIALMGPHVGEKVAALLEAHEARKALIAEHLAAKLDWESYRADKAIAERMQQLQTAEKAIRAGLDELEAAILGGEQR